MIRKEVSGENGGEMLTKDEVSSAQSALTVFLYSTSLNYLKHVFPLNWSFYPLSVCQMHQYTSLPSPTWLTVVSVRRWVSLTSLQESRASPTTPRIPQAMALSLVGQGWVKPRASLCVLCQYVAVGVCMLVRKMFKFKMNTRFVFIRSTWRFCLRMRVLSWRWTSWTSTSAWPPWLPCSATCRETTSPLK